MDDERTRTLLDVLIASRRWTVEECVRHFSVMARELGEPATLSPAQLKRWRRGLVNGLPRPTACRVAERLFGHPIEELLGPPPPQHAAGHAEADLREPVSHAALVASSSVLGAVSTVEITAGPASAKVARGSWPRRSTERLTHALPDVESELIMSTAHEASEHAADAGSAIQEATLEQLHAEVIRLARAYAATPPMVLFAQLTRARDLTYRMVERTRRPAQLSDLYLVAGQLSGLMAAVSFDLGYPGAAGEQARAALAYGQIIDHNELRAWARATLSMISFWSDRPSEGAAHAGAGLDLVSTGDTAVRLHCVAARSWALAGARDEAVRALRAAEVASEGASLTGGLAEGCGGEFTFGRTRQELSAGATWLAMGDGATAAVHARRAMDLYAELLADERSIGGAHGARLDLVIAQVMGRDVDAARETLAPTRALAPEQVTRRLLVRLGVLRRQVGTARFRGSVQATALAEDVEEFIAGSGSRALAGP